MHLLYVIVHIVKMNDAVIMCLDNFRRKHHPPAVVSGKFSCDQIPLGCQYIRIFVGVFIQSFLVLSGHDAEHLIVNGIGLSLELSDLPVSLIGLGRQNLVFLNELFKYLIFDPVNADILVSLMFLMDLKGNIFCTFFIHNPAPVPHGF